MSASKKKIGVLALQGCVEPHRKHIEALGAELVEVRRAQDFKDISGLILPGGESTTMLKLIEHFQIWDVLIEYAEKIPYWGICAGSILMALRVSNPKQKSLGLMHLDVERNSYGRQVDSFEEKINSYPVSFIRAPLLKKLGKACQVKASTKGNPVWVTEGKHMVTTFHPELSLKTPSPFHKYFADQIS